MTLTSRPGEIRLLTLEEKAGVTEEVTIDGVTVG